MPLRIRRESTIIEDKFEDFGQVAKVPLRKIVVVAVVENPYAGRYVEDLKPMIDDGVELGRRMANRAIAAMGDAEVQSYDKGGLVGMAGEQEHANALLTSVFAEPFCVAIGGGKAWISSMTKAVAPGTSIHIPMNHKDEIYVRPHYDGMILTLADAPLPDEIAIIFCMANRGRVNARVGGLTHEDVISRRQA